MEVKEALLADTLSLVAPPHFDRTIWHEMLRWRVGEKCGERSGGRAMPSLAAELCALLHGQTPRASTEPMDAASVGQYERIAPSPAWERICTTRVQRGTGGQAPARDTHARRTAGGAAGGKPRSFAVPAASMTRIRHK
jgi:hypothetical protein